MTLNDQMLQKLVTPKPPRKGETEERIFADMQKRKTCRALIASMKKTKMVGAGK
jgi:hypothetical protein